MTRATAVACSFLVLVALAAWGTDRAAQAQPASVESRQHRLLLFTLNSSDPLVLRVIAELQSQGFLIIQVTPAPVSWGEAHMERMAQESGAVAAVRLTILEREVRVWIGDLIRHRTYEHAIPLGDDATIASLRTVEALRSRLTDLLALAPVPAPAAPAGTPSGVLPPPPQAQHGAGLISGLGRSRGWPVFSWHLGATWRWPTNTPHGVETLALLPVSSASVPASEGGEAELSFAFVCAGWRWQPTLPSRVPIVPSLSVGPGAALVHASGIPASTQEAQRHTRGAFAPYLRLGLGVDVSPTVHLRSDLWAIRALPSTRVLVDQEAVGTWGRVLGIGTLGLEVHWP